MIQSVSFGSDDTWTNTWDDWKIVPTERPVFAPPKPKTTYVDIPGGNGSLDLSKSLTGYPVYYNRTGSFKFRVMNDYVQWYQRYSEIMKYLHGRTMKAILYDEPDWYYIGRFTVDGWASGDTWSTVTISYNVNPYKWALQTASEAWVWDTFNFETGVTTDAIFCDISIDSSSAWVTKQFSGDYFGSAPISPTFIVSDSTDLMVQYVDSSLGIDKTVELADGSTQVSDFIFYGKTQYSLLFKGVGTVSIDFRKGEL